LDQRLQVLHFDSNILGYARASSVPAAMFALLGITDVQ
jgi:hypothetical protein